MILTVDELRRYIKTDLDDDVLTLKLSALEDQIRKHTNNNFQNRSIRCVSEIRDGVIIAPSPHFRTGDTVQVTNSELGDGLFVLVSDDTLSPAPPDCGECLITKVEYPASVKMGVIELVKWDIERRDKIGIASETISRHSVSYASVDGSNTTLGFPSALMGFLKPYTKARF